MKFDRGEAGEPGDEQHDDIGEREAAALARAAEAGSRIDADEGMVAPPIGDRAADEGQDRQRQPGDLVGPQERVLEKDPRGDIGEHQREFAEQRGDDQRFRRRDR